MKKVVCHLSLTNTDNKGIVPNNNFNRKGINLGFSYNLSEKLSFTGNINYTNEINTNPQILPTRIILYLLL